MRIMVSRFPGVCCECSKPIKAQVPIKFYGRGRAAHQNCFNPEGKTERELAAEVRAPCWICGDPQGKFRSLGAATPVWCDKCFEDHQKQTASARMVKRITLPSIMTSEELRD